MSNLVSCRAINRYALRACLTLLLFCLAAVSQAASSHLSDYFQELWTTRDGLPHNTINAIQQSQDGYLWVGTWEGAARFNGRAFTVFGRGDPTGMPDAGIRTISQDDQQHLIFSGARGGISRRTDQGWQSWPAYNVLINAVAEDKQENFWLASEGQGLYRQSPQGERTQFTTADGLPSNVVSSVLATNDGSVWVGTGRGLVHITRNGENIAFSTISDLPAVPVFALREYQDSLLIGTERGLYQYKQGNVRIFSPQLLNFPVSSLLITGEQIWIGTTDRGLLRYGEYGLEKLDMASGLPNNRILSLYQDRENSIWVGTNGGLFRLRDAPFVTLTTEQGLAGNYIRSVLAHSDGSVWIGSSQGVSKITPEGITSMDLSPVSDGQSVLSLIEDPDGSVWIGTYSDGVLHWQDNQIVEQYNRQRGILANEVRAVAVEPDGGLWFGTGHGLNYVDDSGITNFTTKDGLPTPFVMGLYLHTDGRLFIGTGGGVVIRQPDGQIDALNISNLDDAEYAFGFEPDPEAGVLWMATDRGLVAYDFTTGALKMLGRSAGLPFDKVFQAVLDKQKHLWLSSNRGILRFDRQQILDFLAAQRSTVDYTLFGEGDGMQSAQANGGSMQAATLAKDGTVWFATSKGASRVNPSDLARFSASIPPVVIEGFRLNGTEITVEPELALPAGASRLELQFAGLGFVMPERIQYRTQLVGFDTDWVERGTNTTAEYTNLPPGNYQFLVTASYPQGQWGTERASVSFSIAPYFWQQQWFWVVVFFALIALVLVAHRWRMNNLKDRAEELSVQVAEKTFELKQQADYLRAVDEERSNLLQEIQRQAEIFAQQARLDTLTGLANRRAFDEALNRECARARRASMPLCLALLDIDHFKQINDNHNHSVGDEVLKQVASHVSLQCREEDTVARWGGEEFAVLLPNCDQQAAHTICERIRQAVARADCSMIAEDIKLTISIGIASYQHDDTAEHLVSRADNALYRAKHDGRDQVSIAS